MSSMWMRILCGSSLSLRIVSELVCMEQSKSLAIGSDFVCSHSQNRREDMYRTVCECPWAVRLFLSYFTLRTGHIFFTIWENLPDCDEMCLPCNVNAPMVKIKA